MRSLTISLFLLSSVFTSAAQPQSFMFVFLNTNPNKQVLPKEQVDSIQAGHEANMTRLAEQGKLLTSGPFYDGGGIFIMSTASKDTAWEWLKTDPGVRANRWNIELLPYMPRNGSVCSVGENYEMTTYNFVRYTVKEGAADDAVTNAWKNHAQYLGSYSPRDSVIAEGVLGNNESAIFIYQSEQPDNNFIKSEPAVRDGILLATIRKVYIAKGSFCEK